MVDILLGVVGSVGAVVTLILGVLALFHKPSKKFLSLDEKTAMAILACPALKREIYRGRVIFGFWWTVIFTVMAVSSFLGFFGAWITFLFLPSITYFYRWDGKLNKMVAEICKQ
ncbi:MAG: hypothetical protein FWG68_00340 [Defluviitaleaceae bacterium]|nr:hypothetical protein [Defluviitaleaceae bacterium]